MENVSEGTPGNGFKIVLSKICKRSKVKNWKLKKDFEHLLNLVVEKKTCLIRINANLASDSKWLPIWKKGIEPECWTRQDNHQPFSYLL